jgi:WD40 repeat protein
VLTTSFNSNARLWDADSGEELVRLGHRAFVGSASFSPDENSLVTASDDGIARVWDVGWVIRIRGAELRDRVCSERLLGIAQEFTREELQDSILRSIDPNDAIARNPCLRRGPLTREYWNRLWQKALSYVAKRFRVAGRANAFSRLAAWLA